MAERDRVNKSPEVNTSILKETRSSEYAHVLGYECVCTCGKENVTEVDYG